MRQSADVRAREVLSRLSVLDPCGAEIGVWRGQMSEALLRQSPGLYLYMIDPWEGEQQPRTGRGQESLIAETKRRTDRYRRRRKILRLPSVDAAQHFIDGSLDFAFIDADHRYPAVVADILAWAPKVKPGGLLCGHDYYPPHTAERGYGVCQAVDEACERNGWALELGKQSCWFVRL